LRKATLITNMADSNIHCSKHTTNQHMLRITTRSQRAMLFVLVALLSFVWLWVVFFSGNEYAFIYCFAVEYSIIKRWRLGSH